MNANANAGTGAIYESVRSSWESVQRAWGRSMRSSGRARAVEHMELGIDQLRESLGTQATTNTAISSIATRRLHRYHDKRNPPHHVERKAARRRHLRDKPVGEAREVGRESRWKHCGRRLEWPRAKWGPHTSGALLLEGNARCAVAEDRNALTGCVGIAQCDAVASNGVDGPFR